MSEKSGAYQVVWPRGERTVGVIPLAKRLSSLEGKTVAQLWDYVFRGDEVFPVLQDELKRRYPGIKFISYGTFGNTHGEDEGEILKGLPEKLKSLQVDAVISGMGC
jgi:hypothetical protein